MVSCFVTNRFVTKDGSYCGTNWKSSSEGGSVNSFEFFVISTLIAHGLVVLLLIAPRQSVKGIEQLNQAVKINPKARTEFYKMAITGQWLLMPIIFIATLPASHQLQALGLKLPKLDIEAISVSGLAAIALLTQTPLVPAIKARMRTSKSAYRAIYPMRNLLPRSRSERTYWIKVAITAGICEEILFRGFLFYYAQSVLGLETQTAVIGSSLIFAISHYYQGTANMLRIGLVGLALAIVYVVSDSLLWCIALHIALDLGALEMTEIVAADDHKPE